MPESFLERSRAPTRNGSDAPRRRSECRASAPLAHHAIELGGGPKKERGVAPSNGGFIHTHDGVYSSGRPADVHADPTRGQFPPLRIRALDQGTANGGGHVDLLVGWTNRRERCRLLVCNQEVAGSIPARSTNLRKHGLSGGPPIVTLLGEGLVDAPEGALRRRL